MKVIKKVTTFVYQNRRTIGMIVGGILTIAGYPEMGNYAQNVGAL